MGLSLYATNVEGAVSRKVVAIERVAGCDADYLRIDVGGESRIEGRKLLLGRNFLAHLFCCDAAVDPTLDVDDDLPQHVGAGPGRDPRRERRGHQVVVGIDDVGAGQFVAEALQDSLNGEQT